MSEASGNLICAICVDRFRDPVKLPCQHTYCRECIRIHAEKSKSGETCDEPESSTISKQEWLISCPLCRKEADLGKDGVDGLPVNIYMAEMVDNWRSRNENGACAENSENVWDQEICLMHKVALIMYCERCQKLICLECLEDHEQHPMSSKKAAYRNLKEPIEKKTKDCELLKDEFAVFVSELDVVQENIRGSENRHRTEIDQAYSRGLEVLNTWKKDALDRTENWHATLTSEAKTVSTEVSVKLAEIEEMVRDTRDLPASLTEAFLQMSRDLTARMDIQLPIATDFIKDLPIAKKKIEETLKQGEAVPIHLDVKLNVRKGECCILDGGENQHTSLISQAKTDVVEHPVRLAEIEAMIRDSEDLRASQTEALLKMPWTSRMDVQLPNSAVPVHLDAKVNVKKDIEWREVQISRPPQASSGTKRRSNSQEGYTGWEERRAEINGDLTTASV